MTRLLPSISRFLLSEDGSSEDGSAAVEYAVMLALILLASITIVGTLGESCSASFSAVNSSLGSGS